MFQRLKFDNFIYRKLLRTKPPNAQILVHVCTPLDSDWPAGPAARGIHYTIAKLLVLRSLAVARMLNEI